MDQNLTSLKKKKKTHTWGGSGHKSDNLATESADPRQNLTRYPEYSEKRRQTMTASI